MAQPFSDAFYHSETWKRTRAAFIKSRGGLCERCLARGIYRPGVIVHHKTPLTPTNINNPQITLGWSNLELVCRDCHAEIHAKSKRRYSVDEYGRIVPNSD